ncbi:hypothetical protein [Thalassobacillus sp. CUG 92003]|uniref:hypothetical protein n=1 Tax=Thalassobacillus sp. CUG 92003 TaxID=2736641 RepID=UPI0015E70672|nr:hypothetical protein [Thalassobacillus sp. CUG 92003]
MSRYLNKLEPEDVRFLLDYSELQACVEEMLGSASDLVKIQIAADTIQDAYDVTVTRPMVKMEEKSMINEQDRHRLLESGFTLGEPFENGDQALETIFGTTYTVISATEEEEPFFTIELPYRDFLNLKQNG